MRYVVIAMLMALTCFDLNAAQAGTPYERESLRGLPGVFVSIDAISPEAEADGLSTEAVRTAVELTLRSSGIRILDHMETLKTPTWPDLVVMIKTTKIPSANFYFYCLSVHLYQVLAMRDRPAQPILGATWEEDIIGFIVPTRLQELVSDDVEGRIKSFANDFLAVNPR